MTAAQPALLGVGSLCTGSASDRLILQAVSDALAEEGIAVRFVSSFSCEKDPKKQQWIQQVHSAADGSLIGATGHPARLGRCKGAWGGCQHQGNGMVHLLC